jgi:hypothetical protein
VRYFTNIEVLYIFELSVPHTCVLSEVFYELRTHVLLYAGVNRNNFCPIKIMRLIVEYL